MVKGIHEIYFFGGFQEARKASVWNGLGTTHAASVVEVGVAEPSDQPSNPKIHYLISSAVTL